MWMNEQAVSASLCLNKLSGAMLFGLLVGVINAVLISYLGVPAIIGTLGMMFVVRSFELTLTNGAQPQILFTLPAERVKNFFFMGQESVGPISILIILTIVITLGMFLVKERSVFGRHMDCGFFWEWELAIEVAMENDNLYLETSRVPGFETNKIIQKLGGDKVIWGTDGPFCDYEWEFNKIKRYANGEKEFDKIMGGTILSLLKD